MFEDDIMRSGLRLVTLFLWVITSASLLVAQQTPAAATSDPTLQIHDDTPTLHTTARLVVVDVVVTDSQGRSVKGLKQSDFTLLEDNVPQSLASFQEHTALTQEQAAQSETALKLLPNHFTDFEPVPNDNAATVFLLDALDTPIQAQMYLHQQITEYMKTVPAGTKIAIFSLDTQIHMVQEFTDNREMLQQAINSKRAQPLISPLLGGPGAAPYIQAQIRQQYLTEAMQGLARYLAPFPGRKNLIWFTARVPLPVYGPGIGAPFPDITSFIDDFNKTTDVLTLSRIAVYPVDARGLQTLPGFSAARGGRGGLGSIDRFETRQFFQHGDLDDIAEQTGGRAFYNTNGLKEAIAEVVDTGSNYYTLTYSPSNRLWDGNYRHLQVKLADQQKLHLEYRRGYYARNDELAEHRHLAEMHSQRRLLPNQPSQNLPPTAMEDAMKMGAAAPHDVVFVADITPSPQVTKLKGKEPLPKDNFLAQQYQKEPFRDYEVHLSVSPQTVHFMPAPDLSYHGRLEFVVVVFDSLGQVVNSKSSQAVVDVDEQTYAQMMQVGLGTVIPIAIPVKGEYFLRVGVRDVSGNRIGALEIPVDQIRLDLPQTADVSKK